MTNVRKLLNLLSVFGFALPASAADPTLSATPPMTWNSWNHFACKVTAADARSAADLSPAMA